MKWILGNEENEILTLALIEKRDQYETFREQAFNVGLDEWVETWDHKIMCVNFLIEELAELVEVV